MKILLILFVLFFSSSVVASSILKINDGDVFLCEVVKSEYVYPPDYKEDEIVSFEIGKKFKFYVTFEELTKYSVKGKIKFSSDSQKYEGEEWSFNHENYSDDKEVNGMYGNNYMGNWEFAANYFTIAAVSGDYLMISYSFSECHKF